jgi:hypothetical protein
LSPSVRERLLVDLDGPVDVQLLPSGRLLVAENHGSRVTERDRNGKVVWEKKTRSYPASCWRLDNGNTFIATRRELLEVTPEGNTVWSRTWPDEVCCARRLRDGGIALLTASGPQITNHLVYLSAARTEVRRVRVGSQVLPWSTFTILPDGHCLVPVHEGGFDVAEFDRGGRTVWGCRAHRAIGAARLPNGHTLLSGWWVGCLLEVDRAGKVVREHKTEGVPWHVQVIP